VHRIFEFKRMETWKENVLRPLELVQKCFDDQVGKGLTDKELCTVSIAGLSNKGLPQLIPLVCTGNLGS